MRSHSSNWLRKLLQENSIHCQAASVMMFNNWCLQCCKGTQPNDPQSTKYLRCLKSRSESIISCREKPSRTNSHTRFCITKTCLKSSAKASKFRSRRRRSKLPKLRQLLHTCPRPSTWINKIMILASSITSMLNISTQWKTARRRLVSLKAVYQAAQADQTKKMSQQSRITAFKTRQGLALPLNCQKQWLMWTSQLKIWPRRRWSTLHLVILSSLVTTCRSSLVLHSLNKALK